MTVSMKRWGAGLMAAVLAVPAAMVALPASADAQDVVLRAVKHSALRVLDPIMTTAYMSRNHGYMIFDTLFALNSEFEPQPQMVDGWEVSDDQLTWTFTLRDGLVFHDGEPVTSADVIASLRRWGERDSMGQELMRFTSEMNAVDDTTFEIVVSEPFGLMLQALAKPSSNVPFIMPERLAQTPSTEAIPEQIGSGPFVFVDEEFEPGARVVYRKFEDYVPREEEPSWTSGGKRVYVDQVEWVHIPDHGTAVNAVVGGEIDWMENPPWELLPIAESAPNIVARQLQPLGSQGMLRPNFLHAPMNDQKVRQAIMYAIEQESYMQALVGPPEYYTVCGAMFMCGTPLETEAGSEPLLTRNQERARELLEESSYDGEPIVIMYPTDVITLSGYPPVTAQAMEAVGFNVDLQAMDWQTLVSRRASMDPPEEGGWHIFHTNWVGYDINNPIVSQALVSKGTDGGWFGWPEFSDIEELRQSFARAATQEEQLEIAEQIQQRAYEEVLYLPMGQYREIAIYGDHLEGVLEGPAPIFWNIRKNAD
jgi:peptide/nickel transport system substrate-binding protein